MNTDLLNSEIIEKIEEMVVMLSALVRLSIPNLTQDEHSLKGDQEAIYMLCDSTNTIGEIAEIVNKPSKQVRASLSRLKKKGLVDSFTRNKNVYYFRVPITDVLTEE